MHKTFNNFHEFWPFYVGEHARAVTRYCHFLGTACVFVCALLGGLVDSIFWFAMPLCGYGYGFAWFSHVVFERNRPATFRYPVWSLLADFKMFYLMLIGKMGEEVARNSYINKS